MARKKRDTLTKTESAVGAPEDQILTFVTPSISEERWNEIREYLNTIITNATSERTQLDADLVIWNDLYEGKVPDKKDSPWPDASNLNVPLTQEMLDGLHSILSKSSLGVDPLALVKGEDSAGVDVEHKLQQYYSSLANTIDLPEALSQGIFLALRDGVGVLKVTWERRTRKVKTRKMKPVMDPLTQEPVTDPDTMKPMRSEVVEIDEIVEYNNVRVLPVELKDFYLLPAHAYALEKPYSRGTAERIWMRKDQIKARGRSGMYKMAEVEKLLASSAGQGRLSATGNTANMDVDTISGAIQISLTPGFEEFEAFEICLSYDLDEDGYEEECLFTYVPRFNVLLQVEVFPYWHQMHPYVAIIPWPRPRRFYGFSVPQRLESINRELNAIHNQRIDAVSIRLSPPTIVTRSAILRGDASQPWGPGARLEVNNSDDVSVPTLPDINPSSFSEENILRQYAERVVGRYDVNTPRGTGSRRTRAEIGAIQGESMVRFDYMMKLVQRAVVKVFEQIHQLKIQYMTDEGEQFETVGMAGAEKFSIQRQELLANIKFVANGDLPVADKERNRQEAYFLYGALMQNPLVAERPDRIYAVTNILLEAWERKDKEKIIGTYEEVQQGMQQAAMADQQMADQMRAMGVPEEQIPAMLEQAKQQMRGGQPGGATSSPGPQRMGVGPRNASPAGGA